MNVRRPSPTTVRPHALSQRSAGRATLARQHLLRRSAGDTLTTVEHLYGVQAQSPSAPYFALWSRLKGFRPEHLARLIERGEVVRIALMRGTVHLVTADDAFALRALVQPLFDRDLDTTTQHAPHLAGIDRVELAAVGRRLVEQEPRTMAQLRPLLAECWPGRDPNALAHGVRGLVPLVQLPPRGLWGRSGSAVCTTLDSWVGRSAPSAPSVEQMVLRYLAAYGPASVRDVQAWSGLTRLGEVVDRLRPGLERFSSEAGAELFDLPDAPRPDASVPAPVRFLAPYDNMLLSYADRTRFLADEHRRALFTQNGIVKPALLVGGTVAGWIAARMEGATAVLEVSTFRTLARTHAAAVEAEGRRLLRFAHPEAETFDVRIGRAE
ncbi:winged helix DNA-binding domain-containing protein [Rhodococcus sp. TAF43]|uniref:winged helix DNA-binding domain-containing protein n=1 Tax=Rhodococcus sp. TAF43 TaxID=3237483 RepID=UPI003F9792B0